MRNWCRASSAVNFAVGPGRHLLRGVRLGVRSDRFICSTGRDEIGGLGRMLVTPGAIRLNRLAVVPDGKTVLVQQQSHLRRSDVDQRKLR